MRRTRIPARAKNLPPPKDPRAIVRRMVWAGVIDGDDFDAINDAYEALLEDNGLLRSLQAGNSNAEIRDVVLQRRDVILARIAAKRDADPSR